MTTTSEADTKELKELINSRFDELKAETTKIPEQVKNLDSRFDELKAETTKISEQVKNLEIGQAKIETTLQNLQQNWTPLIQKIPDLAEKVGEVKNWRQIALIVITGTFGSVLGWFLRGGKL